MKSTRSRQPTTSTSSGAKLNAASTQHSVIVDAIATRTSILFDDGATSALAARPAAALTNAWQQCAQIRTAAQKEPVCEREIERHTNCACAHFYFSIGVQKAMVLSNH